MKPTTLRTAALLLSLVLLLGTLAACSSGSSAPIEPSEQDIKVVATCGGYDIYYEELRYVVMSYKDQMASRYGEDIWTDPDKAAEYLPLLEQKINENLTVNYAILALAEEFGIDYEGDAIQDAVQELIDETVALAGSREAYIEMLGQMYMTDHFVRFTLATDQCETEIAYTLMDLELVIRNEMDFLEYALNDNNFCTTVHLFIRHDEGETVEANRALAEEALAKLNNYEASFSELLGSKYNDDLSESGSGYTFTRNEYEKEYEEAAFSLKVDQRSGIVECENGFYIIERRELNEAYIMSNLTELLQRYQYAEVEALIDEQQSMMTIEWNDYGKGLDLVAMK